MKFDLAGAWSASPTPFTKALNIDAKSVKRMVKHHIAIGQKGIFIGGTCGEGPWMTRGQIRTLTGLTSASAKGAMLLAVQVTDNSFTKVLEHIDDAKADGADIAIVAEPWFIEPEIKVIEKYYFTILDKSPLPVGIYSRGAKDIPTSLYKQILNHPNVCLMKDSSANTDIKAIALAAARKRGICLLTGCELDMVPYLPAGYTGVLAGGGILIGSLTAAMVEAAKNGDFKKVSQIQNHCNRINYAAYGGKKIRSWLTGLKYALMVMGIFESTSGYLQYPLPPKVKIRIKKMIAQEQRALFPYMMSGK